MMNRTRDAVCVSLFLLILAPLSLGSGCAGTSPAVNPPQMQTPSLRQRPGVGSDPRTAANRATEAAIASLTPVTSPAGLFTVSPYVQWGEGNSDAISVLWQSPGEVKRNWSIEQSVAGSGKWTKSGAVTSRPLRLSDFSPQDIWTANLTGLVPGALFDYRIIMDGKPVFAARARAKKNASATEERFVVFGDCGTSSKEQKEIAFQASKEKPDFVFITGDIVYDRGRYSEYLKNFFPIYNAEGNSASEGASLMRSTFILAAAGNHDLSYKSMDKWPDGLAYFYVWDLPQNGPALLPGAKNTPRMSGDQSAEKAMIAASGSAYPQMANYSFSYGNTHWTVLDSNYYTDWTDPILHNWVEKDLAGAQNATWRFVAFHHPPFHSSNKHKEDQWMRVLTPLFEKYGVSVVWCGHVHNYQRSYPLRFIASEAKPDKDGRVAGTWTLDKAYDGDKVTKTSSPIYIVTGGGGASLYDRNLNDSPEKWQSFTVKYEAKVRSMSSVDINGKTLTVRQIGEDGKELDRWQITK